MEVVRAVQVVVSACSLTTHKPQQHHTLAFSTCTIFSLTTYSLYNAD